MTIRIGGKHQRVDHLNAIHAEITGKRTERRICILHRCRSKGSITKIKHRLRIGILCIMAFQYHADQRHAIPSAGRDQCVAGGHRITGFSCEGTLIIFTVAPPEHTMMGIDRIFRSRRIRILRDWRMGIDLCLINTAEGRIFDGILENLRHVNRTGIVIRIIETRRIHEVRIHASKLCGLLIHKLRELFIRACDIFCESVRTVICRMKKKTIKTVPHAQRIASYCTDHRRIFLEIRVGSGIRKGHAVIKILCILQHNNGGHHLRDRRRKISGSSIFLIKYCVRICIKENTCLRLNLCRWNRPGGSEGGSRRKKGHEKKKYDGKHLL